MDSPMTKEVARFFDKVNITRHCWLWSAAKYRNGYGAFSFCGGNIKAHRFSYELFVGPIEMGKLILHRRECGNRNCVNPNHLYMGTHRDNMRDMCIWGNIALGERSGNSKLSKSDVINIRKYHKDKAYKTKDIAEMFDISQMQVGRIVRGLSWKHI